MYSREDESNEYSELGSSARFQRSWIRGRRLDEVSKYADHILVVDDGSSDGTSEILDRREDIAWFATRSIAGTVLLWFPPLNMRSKTSTTISLHWIAMGSISHRGSQDFSRLPGSRYRFWQSISEAVRRDNERLPSEFHQSTDHSRNQRTSRTLSDRCVLWLQAYRVESLKRFHIEDTGYAMPLELWVQAAMQGMSILEVPVPLIYLDLKRSFGGALDHAETRLKHYYSVLDRSVAAMRTRGFELP